MNSDLENFAETEKKESDFNWKLFFLSLFFGYLGADRFYAKKTGTGVLKLLTLGVGGIWWLVDLFLIASGKFSDASGKIIGKFNIKAFCIASFSSIIFMMFVFQSFNEQEARIEQVKRTEPKAKIEQVKQAKPKSKKQEDKEKKQKYEEMYGKTLYEAQLFYKTFRDNSLAMNRNCNEGRPPMYLRGQIIDMGSNSYGKYIDLYTHYNSQNQKAGDIRVFLVDNGWNNSAITNIKLRDMINVGGLCYGQTEAFGIKSKIIIGNASIIKVNGKFL